MNIQLHQNIVLTNSKEPLDILFVGSMNEYKDKATRFLLNKGVEERIRELEKE